MLKVIVQTHGYRLVHECSLISPFFLNNSLREEKMGQIALL